MKIFIYQIWFPTNSKSYIGQTDNLKRRMSKHQRKDSLVGRALRKYDDWRVCILHTTNTRDAANLIEIEEIRNFNTIAPNGYNITRGGAGSNGFHHTEASKRKIGVMSSNRSPEANKKISVANTGKKYSDVVNKKKGTPGNQHRSGLIPWNKGLTKETDMRVADGAKKLSQIKMGSHQSPEHAAKSRVAALGTKRSPNA